MRARDADRNLVVEALESAYVDGQLDGAEREQRVAQALSSKSVSELRKLIGDLQDPPTIGRAETRPFMPKPVTPPSGNASRPKAVAVVVAALAAVALVPTLVDAFDSDDTAYSTPVTPLSESEKVIQDSRSQVVLWSEVKDDLKSGDYKVGQNFNVPQIGRWALTSEKVKLLVQLLEAAFKAPYLHDLRMYDDTVTIVRPVSGTQVRLQEWDYRTDGGFTFSDKSDTTGRDIELFDLNDLDIERLFSNVGHALAELNVEDARLDSIGIEISGSKAPQISIQVDNRLDENAMLWVTLDGRIIQEFPYEP